MARAAAQNIRRRGNAWITYFRVNGKQDNRTFSDSKWGGKEAAHREAKLYLARSLLKKDAGAFKRSTKMRFADFAVEWLRDYAKGNVRERTFEGYETALRCHLVPHFGDLLLTQITRKLIDAFIADWLAGGPYYKDRLQLARELEAKRLSEAREAERKRAWAENRVPRHIDPRSIQLGRSPGTIGNALTPFVEMLGHAVEWEYLAANPAVGVKRPRVVQQEMHVLDGEQIRTLLDGTDKKGTPHVRKEWRTFFLCAATTGMRLGELLALRWGDVDWQSRRLWVRRSITRNGTVQEPKTRGSVRAVAITPTLVTALRQHRMASGFKGEDALIFCTAKGTPLSGVNLVRREFKPALRRAKLPEVRFHDLRHSFASLLIAQGEHPKLISEQLGHASTKITLDRYGHLMDQSYGDASSRLDAALFGNVTPIERAQQK
jgi:integrase